MVTTILVPTWNCNGKSVALGLGVGTALTLLVAHHCAPQKKPCSQEPTMEPVNREYIFCPLNGKPITLTEDELFSIRQMKANGVLPSVIAREFNLSIAAACLIINASNNLKTKEL